MEKIDPESLLAQRKALAAELRLSGVGAQSERFAALARPSVVLEPGDGAGRSRLGGNPDLPVGQDWPMRARIKLKNALVSKEEQAFLDQPQPLSLIAQIDLGHLAERVVALPGMPDRGMLYFFYDVVHQGWGFDPKDRAGFRVLWVEDADGLVEAVPPAASLTVFPKVALSAQYKLDPIDTETRVFEAADTTDPEAGDAYLDWLADNRFDTHKLGGWPEVVQGEMESECALASNGIHSSGAGGYQRPVVRGILAEETDWRLLLQIGSDAAADMMWGDLGMLYVWIRECDLKARRFDQCWVILQCG